jgi:hypothetical protein
MGSPIALAFPRRFAALLLAGLTLSGCISTYRDYPRVRADAAELAATERPLAYSVSRYPDIISPFGVGSAGTLQKVFERTGGFTQVSRVKDGDPLPDGLFVLVETSAKAESESASVFGVVSAQLLLLVPAFSTKGGYSVSYTLWVDRVQKKTYRYQITRQYGVWLLFLPLIWVNLLTPTARGAFRSTAYAFVRDARADGLLPAPGGDEGRTARR